VQPVASDDVEVSQDGHNAPGHDVEQLAQEVHRRGDTDPEFHGSGGKRESGIQ